MANIDDLFDWILEDIFLNLPRHDRLVCKQVCNRWYCLLMERAIFRKDRHIFLNTCDTNATDDAMTVLIRAKKPYEIYTVRDYIEDQKVGLRQFFDLVGPFIEEFKYEGNAKCGDIFTSLTSLKYLTLNLNLAETGDIFSTIKRNNPNFTFHHLEKLQIGEEVLSNSTKLGLLFIVYIKKFIPRNCSINLPQTSIYSNETLEPFCQMMEEVTKINIISVYAPAFSQTEIEKLLQVKNINCDKFILKCTSIHRPYDFLEALENKHPNLKEIKLECVTLPSAAIDLTKLVHLKLEFSVRHPSLKSLEQLRSLKELDLFFVQNECGFGHQTLNMPNLYRLKIRMDELCHDCLDALTKSFVNLGDFSLTSKSIITWYQLTRLIANWKKLREFELYIHEITNQEEDFNFDPNENFQKIHIYSYPDVRIKTMEKMVESFRNLEYIYFHSEEDWFEVTLVLNIIYTVLPSLAKLKYFAFWFDSSNYSDEYVTNVYDMFCEYMSSIGLPLQNKDSAKKSFVSYNFVELNINRKEMTSELGLAE